MSKHKDPEDDESIAQLFWNGTQPPSNNPIDEEKRLGISPSSYREFYADFDLDEAKKNTIPFGIQFLDSSIYGVMPEDLVLVGAGSGIGKTALALDFASQCAMKGKKVLFIALEAGKREIEHRLRYQIMSKLFYRDIREHGPRRFDFRTYRYGRAEDIVKKYSAEVTDIYFSRYGENLFTLYKEEKAFDVRRLEEILAWAQDNMSMVIIDHLHYFDYFRDEKSSTNDKMGKLMMKIRDINLHYRVPIILVAHLRKDLYSPIPDLGDFMGSSDIGKIATTAIMISKLPASYDPINETSKTIMSIPKSRAGSLNDVVGIVEYSTRYNQYLDNYQIATFNKWKSEMVISNRGFCPFWARTDNYCLNGNETETVQMGKRNDKGRT